MVKIDKKVEKLLKRKKILFFATSSKKGKPNLIAVESMGLFSNKILLTDCQMKKTLKNLKENKLVSICVTNNKNYFQIKGIVSYYKKGKWFELAKKMLKKEPYKPKGAILISIREIYDLDKCKRIL